MLDSLKTYLEIIRRLTHAEAGSLFIPTPTDSEIPSFLCHVGAPNIPELQDLETATAFSLKHVNTGPANSEVLMQRISSSTRNSQVLCIRVDILMQQVEAGQLTPVDERRRYESAWTAANDDRLWLGLRWELSKNMPLPSETYDLSMLASEPPSEVSVLLQMLAASAHMACAFHRCAVWQQDPLSRMPGRAELQSLLTQLFRQAVEQAGPMSLLLVNPDDFASVNQRLGRQQGDSVMAEMAERLRTSLRHSDLAFRYGGAVFAVLLPGMGNEGAKAVADKLRHVLSQSPYAQAAVRLAFSMGMAIYDPAQKERAVADANEMLLRADKAINQAKLAGGGRTVVWDSLGEATVIGSLDRLSGIFTADTEKDYRNMLLLWETVAFIATHSEGDTIAREFISRIYDLFKPFRAALLAGTGDESRLLAECVTDQGRPWLAASAQPNQPIPWSDSQQQLFDQVSKCRQVERLHMEEQVGRVRKPLTAYAIPMVAADSYQGCLYIEMLETEARLDSSDLVFLSTLANQVATALAHAYLAARWKQKKEQESSQLKQEVRGLRQALQHSKMVFHSSQMHTVMDTLLKVAPTDATVLVTGESGTGKEMLARSLHEMSLRKEQPFVTVDCGAISHTLLEAELFGRAKGAYTGADSAASGHILQADGGTLFLDEVGELPLDVQSKLLRFVQEKEITPVGSSQSRQVDVRIVAATNRNLAEEARLGRFRQDLYYRLQVFVVEAVPLRARPDDILPLARFFLEKFCVQYQKGPLQLTADTEAALLAYPWPGNVRELQNQILKVVVMCTTDSLNVNDLQLPGNGLQSPSWPATGATPQIQTTPSSESNSLPSTNDEKHQAPPQVDTLDLSGDPWEILRQELQSQVRRVIAQRKAVSEPLGRWLGEDLVLLADEINRGIARRAASLLGMAETTFRRQVQKARQDRETGRLTRTAEWMRMGPVLSYLLASLGGTSGENLSERIRESLLEEVTSHLPDQDKTAAALMGVTLPTYRRWKETVR